LDNEITVKVIPPLLLGSLALESPAIKTAASSTNSVLGLYKVMYTETKFRLV